MIGRPFDNGHIPGMRQLLFGIPQFVVKAILRGRILQIEPQGRLPGVAELGEGFAGRQDFFQQACLGVHGGDLVRFPFVGLQIGVFGIFGIGETTAHIDPEIGQCSDGTVLVVCRQFAFIEHQQSHPGHFFHLFPLVIRGVFRNGDHALPGEGISIKNHLRQYTGMLAEAVGRRKYRYDVRGFQNKTLAPDREIHLLALEFGFGYPGRPECLRDLDGIVAALQARQLAFDVINVCLYRVGHCCEVLR